MRFLLAALVFAAPWITCAELQGARRVIDTLALATNAAPESADGPGAKEIKERIDGLAGRVATLAPADAAAAWLELADSYLALPMERRYDRKTQSQVAFASTLKALPAPEAWPEIRRRLAERAAATNAATSDKQFLIFGDLLIGDRDAVRAGLRNLARQSAGRSGHERMAWSVSTLQQEMLRLERDPKILKALLMADIEAREKGKSSTGALALPDLVTLYGRADAEAVLRRALVLPGADLRIDLGLETSALARKLALDMVDKLQAPCWSLVTTLDSVALYEALDKKFPRDAKGDGTEAGGTEGAPPDEAWMSDIDVSVDMDRNPYGQDARQVADDVYLLGLIAAGRTDDAVACLKAMKDRSQDVELYNLDQLDRAGYTDKVFEFIMRLLGEHPEYPLWNPAIELGARLGRSDQVTQLVQEKLSAEGLPAPLVDRLKTHLVTAMLAADRVDEAVVLIRQLIQEEAAAPAAPDGEPVDMRSVGAEALRLASLGQLLDRRDLLDEGLAAAASELRGLPATREERDGGSLRNGLAHLYMDLKQYDKAEAIRVEELQRCRERAQGRDDMMVLYYMRSSLIALAGLYFEAGRLEDVRVLLDDAPWWGVRDLADLRAEYFSSRELPFAFIAAKAFEKSGDTELARKAVTSLLRDHGACDPALALLVDLDGTNAIPVLDRLYARDRFEERPLIWKAEALRRAGRLAEAEKAAREAIGVDPSDGGTGKGDRMRAYAVLGSIRDELGDEKDAAFYDGVITAIRHAEDADDYYEAGLLSRGVSMYESSLTYFADAYCIQSRLAVQLAELGRQDEAEAHYQRAYELMPDSFGRMESHCFGCEHVFQGAIAQSIAEKVFTRLVKERPDNPRTHYLLAYLRNEQEDYPSALKEFRRAVALDPDYLSAWSKLSDLSGKMQFTAEESDDIAFNLMRLDPLQRHTSAPTDRVQDLGRLWTEASKTRVLIDPPDRELYPLRASRERIDQAMKERGAEYGQWIFSSEAESLTPGDVVARHRLVAAMAQFMDGLN